MLLICGVGNVKSLTSNRDNERCTRSDMFELSVTLMKNSVEVFEGGASQSGLFI